jgi:outer membrane murein-binding lipoprotein Lpp
MPDDRESDPRERTIAALVDEVQSQRARLSALEDQLANAAVSSSAAKSTAAKATPRRGKSPR